jgi:hypothetical protein
MPCPSPVVLDQYLLTPSSVAAREHIESCESCRARLAQLRDQDERFVRFTLPETLDAVIDAAAPKRWSRRLVWLLPAVAAAAALLVVMVQRPAPAPGYLALKGDALTMHLFVEAPKGARELSEGERVGADARVRATIQINRPCWLWLLSVDAAGQVSRLYPLDDDGGRRIGASGPIPGGAQLDGLAGPERLIAVCAPEPLSWAVLDASARRTFREASSHRVRSIRLLEGLPEGTLQASTLLEKAP